MNNIFPILLVSFGLLMAQTDAEIKQAKKVIKKMENGISYKESRKNHTLDLFSKEKEDEE